MVGAIVFVCSGVRPSQIFFAQKLHFTCDFHPTSTEWLSSSTASHIVRVLCFLYYWKSYCPLLILFFMTMILCWASLIFKWNIHLTPTERLVTISSASSAVNIVRVCNYFITQGVIALCWFFMTMLPYSSSSTYNYCMWLLLNFHKMIFTTCCSPCAYCGGLAFACVAFWRS